ncbi:hypothetical protein [Maribacter sp. 2210JD10-5]|uniref:hypothetical protein n=1 Tax=Maribacter sp. 2210JD10-5 TaxID=3386272 RepID=UPI0039BD0BDB
MEQASLRLNNFTPDKNEALGEYEFYLENDSNLELFGNVSPINIGTPIETGPNEMYKMYVNDWGSRDFSARGIQGNTIRLEILMEDAGYEIIGKCHDNFLCGFSPAPSFNFLNTAIRIDLNLNIQNNELDFHGVSKIIADIQETGPCTNNVFAMFCPSNKTSILKTNFETRINRQINGRYRNQILDFFNMIIELKGIDLNIINSIYIDSDENIMFFN